MAPYSSTEVGRHLAAAIVHNVCRSQTEAEASSSISEAHKAGLKGSKSSGTEGLQQQQQPMQQLPVFKEAKVMGATLPGGWTFANAAKGGQQVVRSAGKRNMGPILPVFIQAGGRALLSKGEKGVLLLVLDSKGCIEQATYLGPQPAEASKLGALVGLPFSYLQEGLGLPHLKAKATVFGAGGATGLQGLAAFGVEVVEVDMLECLGQSWAQLLFHDGFSSLREQLLALVSRQALAGDAAAAAIGGDADAWDQDSSAKTLQAQAKALDMMNRCRTELAGYGKLAAGQDTAQVGHAQ
jgi:hypothetical protein